jgi:hypothetical protein
MTLKKKFECDSPEVVLLKNKRYAYKALCPWKGVDNKDLYAFKFASSEAYNEYSRKNPLSEKEHSKKEITAHE